jgi:hypothetical protein
MAGFPEFKLPEFKLPAMKLPKLDLAALFALQKANLAAAQEAQSVLLDAGQAIARIQAGYVEGLLAEAKAAFQAKAPKQPEAVLADAKAAAEKAVTVAKEGVDLGVAAQRKVAELVASRAQANLAGLKALAA